MRHSCSASYNPAIDKEQLAEDFDKVSFAAGQKTVDDASIVHVLQVSGRIRKKTNGGGCTDELAVSENSSRSCWHHGFSYFIISFI